MKKETQKTDSQEEELEKAFYRMGSTPADSMKWVIRFAYEERALLSSGDRMNRDYELVSFLRFGLRHGMAKTPAYILTPWMDVPPGWGNLVSPIVLPEEPEILDLQNRTKAFLFKLVAEEVIDLGDLVQNIRVKPAIQIVEHGPDPAKEENLTIGIFVPRFETHSNSYLYLLGQLLAAHMGKVKNCPECQRVFLQERRNQKYCTTTCQSRIASRRFLGISEERRGKVGRPPKKGELKETAKSRSKAAKGKGVK